jgi:hypothetical protein
VATALDIERESRIRSVTWGECITLPVREADHAVRTSDLQVQLRLPHRFIAGSQQHRGLGVIVRAQAFLPSGCGTLDVKHTAPLAAKEDEALFHNFRLLVRKL